LKVAFDDQELSYIAFITPSLLAIAMMYNAFFENTYASFVRMYYQKTFDAMLATPLSLDEVISGEIVWGATKSLVATTIMLGSGGYAETVDSAVGFNFSYPRSHTKRTRRRTKGSSSFQCLALGSSVNRKDH